MSAILELMFRRLPIGWLQLIYSKTRLAAALAGVAFANILVFMQLGFLGALIDTIRIPYEQFNADILIVASDMNTLSDGSPLPRQRMYQALSVEGVARATPVYHGKLDWKQADGTVRTLDVFGIDPSVKAFRNPEINARLVDISLSNRALLDRKIRNVPRSIFAALDRGEQYVFEVLGRQLTVAGAFNLGGGFTGDGYMIVSDQTFLKLYPQRSSGAPNYIFVSLAQGAQEAVVAKRLRQVLPDYDTSVRTRAQAIAKDQAFQTTQKPVGLVFGFGIVIGILVGVIIVYQVLSTDVADHMKEYATFKAIGYRQSFFMSIILEEALVLAVLGFIPGIVISLGLYAIVAQAAQLPLSMTVGRGLMVLAGTIAMCVVSGTIATRRLNRANPADLF
ncbi:MAG: FtsX-like permease family protein [Hyphomicrobiales bacterium]|nr:FtsX-like permease family protein [Hyphomicrobiales bacterium]